MGKYQAVFSDIDGTFLNSKHQVSPLTREAVKRLQERGIPFVLVSARSPSEIEPILEECGLSCSFIACSGGLILDERRDVLWEQGMEQKKAEEIVAYLEEQRFPLAWCVYSLDQWLVKSRQDPRIIREEEIVGIKSREGSVSSLPKGDKVYKLMCICDPGWTLQIEEKIQARFPDCTVVKSSDILIEIMPGGVDKAGAVEWLCRSWQMEPAQAIAFGDNYNDLQMLRLCHGIAMGNAPEEIRKQAAAVTRSHDEDGIYWALRELKLI